MSTRQPLNLEKHVLGSAFVSTMSATLDDDSTMAVSSSELGLGPRGPLIVAEFSAQLKNHLAPIFEEVRANRRALDSLQDSILQLSTQIEASGSTQIEASRQIKASRPDCFETLPVLKHWDTALEQLGLHLKESRANQELSKANLKRLEGIRKLCSRDRLSKAEVAELEPSPAPPLMDTLDITLRSGASETQMSETLGSSGFEGSNFRKPNSSQLNTGTQSRRSRSRNRLKTPFASIHIPHGRNTMLAVVAEHLEKRKSTTSVEAYIIRNLRWLIDVEEPPRTTALAKVVDGKYFALFFGLVILANIVSLAVDANHQMDHSINDHFEHLEWLFLVLYSIEIAMKLAVHQWYLFVGPGHSWNIFDAILVVVSLYSNVMPLLFLNRSRSASSVQTLRIFKIVRIFKAIRLIRVFSIMERIFNVMAGTLFILVGGLLMMALLLFVFGLLCVHLLSTDGMDAQSNPVLFDEVRSIFGSVQLGMFTLFRSAWCGEDWNQYFKVIAQVSPLTAAVFIFFVAFVQISFFNILTAMFVVQAKILGKPDQETKAMEETLKQRRDNEKIWELCEDMDRNGSKTICREEFYESLQSDNIRSQFMLCGLNINNAEDFFELLLSMSINNEVELDKFVSACVLMKGGATAIEQNMILLEARDFQQRMGDHFLRLKYWQADVSHKLDALSLKGFGADSS